MTKLIAILSIFLFVTSTSTVFAQKKKMQSAARVLFGIGVIESSDKFEGTTTYEMTGNKVFTVVSGTNALGNVIFGTKATTYDTFLNLEKHLLKDGSFDLSIILEVKAVNDVTVDIQDGKSLIFLLNDDRIELSTKGAFNTGFDFSDSSSKAHARYPLTEEQLDKINNSDEVEFRIILDSYQSGEAEDRDKSQQHLDGKFRKKNKKAWKEFDEEYLTP